MRPIGIPQNILQHHQSKECLKEKLAIIRNNIKRLHASTPEVSIIIPAYNEEESILKTLSSFSATSTKKTVEIIVVNNNSKDTTGELAIAAGTTCIIETKQGITPARNAGLYLAKGKFILNADADTIYPPHWIDLMTEPLNREGTVMAYGMFAFIPTTNTPRIIYFGYEYISDLSRLINKKLKEEAVNIYGFNSAFRREEGLEVGGFKHPPGTNEDGWMGLKLRNTFNKKLCHVTNPEAIVWTSDRRIQMDGGIVRGTIKRLKRYLNNFT